eukprot:3938521-Rhodomonas_salina.1
MECVGALNTVIGSIKASGRLRSLPKITAPMTGVAPKLTGHPRVSIGFCLCLNLLLPLSV